MFEIWVEQMAGTNTRAGAKRDGQNETEHGVSADLYEAGAAAACSSARRMTSMRNVWCSGVSDVVASW